MKGLRNVFALVLGLIVAGGLGISARAASDDTPKRETAKGKTEMATTDTKTPLAYVRVIGKDGKLTEPVLVPKLILSNEEWKQRLTPEQFRILRNQGTEAAFCGGLLKEKDEGIYACVACGLPLFESKTKFESGTGWPSFYQAVGSTNIAERPDFGHGMVRTEILCARCDGHLGHLFPDGPKPTGLRYCLNSESLKFIPTAKLAEAGEEAPKADVAEAVIAGGCFWCVEAVFEEIDGVLDVVSGYAGGDAASANYQAVSTGRTKHAEAVRIVYDPKKVTLEQLLEIHFATHDPTTLNRQGNDVGPQYRSTVFYANEEEKKIAEKYIAKLTAEKKFGDPIVTTLEPLTDFYLAEPYHQNYVCRNPMNGYVRGVAMPKVDKVRTKFSDQIRGLSTKSDK